MSHILFLIFFIQFVSSVERIWLLRHCDKPSNNESPCCSSIGYQRAENWFFYLTKYLNKNNKIAIYSSNYNEKKLCLKNNNYIPDYNCQKSQRMFLTAYYIHNKLTSNNFQIKKNINLHYCIGNKIDLINNIIVNEDIDDAIIVWEHKEIIEIIRYFNINIKKWKNKFTNVYDLIFLIDLHSKQLYIDCFNFQNNSTLCSKEVKNWLQPFPLISNYYDKNQYSTILKSDYTNKLNKLLSYLFINLSLYILFFGIYILILRIFKFTRRHRDGYVQII
jgi:hypothetical protein